MTHTKSSKASVSSKKTDHKEKKVPHLKEEILYAEALLGPPPVVNIGDLGDSLFADREMTIPKDPNSIDFEIHEPLQTIPGLFQGVAMIFSDNHSFELLNGSKWSTSNIEMIKGWLDNPQLLISQNQAFFSTYRFSLLNTRLGKAAPITLLREPRPTDRDTFFITKIDLANDLVILNGFQEWTIYPHDQGTLRKFSEHDRVMIGINTTDYALEKPMRYILIDTATNLYVRANLLAF